MTTIGVLFKDVKNKISYIHLPLRHRKINFILRYHTLNPLILYSCRTYWAHEGKKESRRICETLVNCVIS